MGAPARCRFAVMRRATITFVARQIFFRQICRSATPSRLSQPLELSQCWLQARSNLLQFAVHSDLPQLTMHCSCSSGSAHCVRQASAFVLQLVWQASAWLSLYAPMRERSPAGDGAPLAMISAPKMQVVSRNVFMDAFSRRGLEWIRPAIEFRMFRPVFLYHNGRPEGMTA